MKQFEHLTVNSFVGFRPNSQFFDQKIERLQNGAHNIIQNENDLENENTKTKTETKR